MKKVININFQGRVIPIEETAYEILKQYIESLRRYFSNEEGRDEIINDIESRIAELFSERLKKGITCITDEDVQAVMASMGRPEDFEAETGTTVNGGTTAGTGPQQQGPSQQSQSTGGSYGTGPARGRLYRNADDKIIAGVCSGLANYFHIDPVIMRIIFVVLFFTGGSGFLVYLILWVVVPSQSIQSNITKRLYRSSEDKVFAGVCGGLAAYFNINTWVPRLIFALPLIIGLLSGPFNWWWGDMDFWIGPRIITGSLSSTLFITYIVLWIAVPIAVTAAEKLEMRGERVDLNSIRDTVKEDLEGFRSRAQNWGNDIKQSAQQFGNQAKQFSQSERVKTFTTEASTAARGAGSGIAHILGVLFKAFFLFIVGMIALALFGVLVGLLFGGVPVMAFKEFLLEGFWQNSLAWLTVLLFLGVPIIALITWLIRRIMGVRSRNHYLGYVFGTLWFVGIVSAALLTGSVFRNFKSRNFVEENISMAQPTKGKLYLDVTTNNINYRYYSNDWFDWDDGDWPLFGANLDSILLNTVRIDVVKSNDSGFHITKVKFSRGKDPVYARNLAEKINFTTLQNDSVLFLPKGFSISKNERWRNQQVLLILQVPVGKKFRLDRSVSKYDWFDVRYNHRGGLDIEDTWERTYWVESGKDYIMTPDGPKQVSKLDPEALSRGEYKERDKDQDNEEEEIRQRIEERRNRRNEEPARKDTTGGYRYRKQTPERKSDSTPAKANSVSASANEQDEDQPATLFSARFASNSKSV